jgi:hypothetical protein
MGVVRATHFSHTKWATWAGFLVTFCGLGRFRVKKSRGICLGMATPGARAGVPEVAGVTTPTHRAPPGVLPGG